MRIVFMGTPEFAVPSLKRLFEEGYDVLAVVTQPDKQRGRGMKVSFSPVKELALQKGVKVLQPESVKNNPEFLQELKELNPEVIVVAAYGKILPEEILTLPEYGCINVHASLLPKYRGAAPINWAIINGEKETGITTMLMDKGLDTGEMLLKRSIAIEEDDDAQTLHDKLANLGAEVLSETLKKLKEGKLIPEKQKDEEATYAPIITKEMGHIDWKSPACRIRNLIRGLKPWPGCYTFYDGKMLKIWKAEVVEHFGNEPPGSVLKSKDELIVKCGENALRILEIQQEGSRKMGIREYLIGHNIPEGTILK
ncbi:methionyl-tRNA formyltransferase [Caldanaerobacter subterraneus subsp. yonseiensis KB-1]|uniref:Methionyl-tRNA formyltransferase n=1 Tax=Caldanaerobacter subterraneus subsp. yonseiensis KB-1 TaxID=1388761 RepID=U5CTZ2_CALSX|nr:methionyl-tRNA formyltransferase [Caldanaerobacter subterraneus]ERM92386.1 methionyl-tRNA formyltransferase [Caldanaerobacter subterraneus subsp. yonseiensis KB-1]